MIHDNSLSFVNSTKINSFTFIDLFAGIGGMRTAFNRAGGYCVFTSEWNKFAQKTYEANFRDNRPIAGDITGVNEADIPDHDVLLAGFPCQPFSIAGKKQGFKDETQGTLFFDVARIIQAKKPKAFLLENVKNLKSHDKGRTLEVILRILQDELGYNVTTSIINADGFVPQHRERIVIVGFRDHSNFSFENFKRPEKKSILLNSILHPEDGSETPEEPYTIGDQGSVSTKYTLSDNLWTYLQKHAAKHKKKGNGFGFGLVTPDMISRTLSARYYKDGSEILIHRGERRNPRKLTPRECARLMGFPEKFKIPNPWANPAK